MNECICCRDRLIRHVNHQRMYWYCPSCHQEMPNLDEVKSHPIEKVRQSILFPSRGYLLKH